MKPQRHQHRQGIALVSVLSVATVCIILAATFSFVITQESKSTSLSAQMADSLQTADAATERARMLVVKEYKDSFLTSKKFLVKLRDDKLASLLGTQTISINGKEAYWKITSIARPIDSFHWVEIAATAETSQGSQTVIRRINLGQSEVFELAMLSERTDCIYCHLRVNGDVGSLGFLRPGWGTEGGGGTGSGSHYGGSKVNGSVYVAPSKTKDASGDPVSNISADDTSTTGSSKKINGAEFTGDIVENYSGGKLPLDKDNDGIPDFPEINRTIAQSNATGSITGAALMYVVPNNTSLTGVPGVSSTSAINKKVDGNLILVGTKSNPIVIDEDIYVSGDVIIKGYVKGKGAIYAGRNLYAAGNISYINKPTNCAQESKDDPKLDPDQCAVDVLANESADELRLAARGNIVLGDYTEEDASGNPKSWQASQPVDYFRSQFGMWGGNKYFDKATGDELRCNGSICKNVDGTEISAGNVVTVAANAGNAVDAYDYSLKPGSIDTTGNFNSWMSDDLYQQLLGTETRKNDYWRKSIGDRENLRPADVNDPASVTAAMDYLRTMFGPAGSQLSEASLLAIMCLDASKAAISCGDVALTDSSGNNIGSLTGNGTVRVTITSAATYEKQVTNVDAFLYSNQRIAGKTFGAPMVINGGMVSRDIGILAPGIDGGIGAKIDAQEESCGDQSFADQFRDTSLLDTDPNYYNGAFNPDADDCALTVNYDYRLRNGGYGFNLVAQDVGRTSSWRVGAKRSDRVSKP
ncbi:MAG: hypothetical protein KC422_25075 [Trueperaceae bacterium]|nr:hypothetical protein [Trueperaceae bacterium]